ncbi:hypothetical protein [Falsiroseomonas sp. HW251]|uniref:hypothetical protein n=1 Tax=Falsiroseomonas sp. HW251 TaxID=3390998 RepID=UPI003D312B02
MRDHDRLLLAASAALMIMVGLVLGSALYAPPGGRVDGDAWLAAESAAGDADYAWTW